MADPLAWIDSELAEWNERGLGRKLNIVDRRLINFASNDYLGLASDPRLAQAAQSASVAFGAGASPLVSGWTEAHHGLAEALARFEKTESVVLFPSGYAANLGTICALVSQGDAIYLDRLTMPV